MSAPSRGLLAEASKVTPELQLSVEQFYYHEAELLDTRAYRDWYALLAPDLRYRMPLRFNRNARERDHEFSRDDETFLFDETKASIDVRIKRLETGMAWAEEPPSRTRHLVTNLRLRRDPDREDVVLARSYFHLYRSRLERLVEQFVGERTDTLRVAQTDVGWELAERYIVLDQSTVLASNMSMFF